MKSARTVLIVAPDEELRRSIAFALEAEGLRVASQPRLLPEGDARQETDIACLVVDEDALKDGNGGWPALADTALPVILLVDRLRAIPQIDGMSTLDKPLLGQVLVDAVLAAMARHAGFSSTT